MELKTLRILCHKRISFWQRVGGMKIGEERLSSDLKRRK